MASRLAPAKINLTLHVTGQRDDGFHELDSLVCFADTGDHVQVHPADTLVLNITGPYGKDLTRDENLVLRAAGLFNSGTGADITLTKNLPVAAGLGGGSADAAATLHLLSDLWNAPLPEAQKTLNLGADIPVCLRGRPAIMRGIGDQISPALGLPVLDMVLVNPNVSVSTQAVFSALKIKNNGPMGPVPDDGNKKTWMDFLRNQRNDLEIPARDVAPEITTVLERLWQTDNCQLARMSGSGATCFGIYLSEEAAKSAARSIRSAQTGWWVQTTRATT